MTYTTKYKFMIDGNIVCNLRPDQEKGRVLSQYVAEMINDVAVSIEARHLTEEDRADIIATICDALNKNYVVKKK